MRPCTAKMERRSSVKGRPCPSRTKHPSGVCALHRAAAEAKEVRRILRLYRVKFAASDMGGWDARAHLWAKEALIAAGEPRMTFGEACEAATEEAPRARA
jgi:hypothetical protein